MTAPAQTHVRNATPNPGPSGAGATSARPSEAAVSGQTHELPSAASLAFLQREAALWAGIVHGDAELAMPSFVPLAAYQQVKDVANPAADWKARLVTAFRRDVARLHSRLGATASRAKFISIDVPEARARWVNPGEEWNRVGYFRVFGSKLRFEVDGQPRVFDIKSLISWQGQWYVVHLSAID